MGILEEVARRPFAQADNVIIVYKCGHTVPYRNDSILVDVVAKGAENELCPQCFQEKEKGDK